MALPSDEQFKLELNNLSAHLYDVLNRAGELAPTYQEWDDNRDPKWSQSRSILKVFGLQPNRVGWTNLVQAFGFWCPTLGDAKSASFRRKKRQHPYPPYCDEDDSYPGLQGRAREEVYYEDLGGGKYRKTTRTIISIR